VEDSKPAKQEPGSSFPVADFVAGLQCGAELGSLIDVSLGLVKMSTVGLKFLTKQLVGQSLRNGASKLLVAQLRKNSLSVGQELFENAVELAMAAGGVPIPFSGPASSSAVSRIFAGGRSALKNLLKQTKMANIKRHPWRHAAAKLPWRRIRTLFWPRMVGGRFR